MKAFSRQRERRRPRPWGRREHELLEEWRKQKRPVGQGVARQPRVAGAEVLMI